MAYWLTEAWYCALYSDLLVEEGLQARTLLDQPMVLWRDTKGAVHAMEDRCPHRYAPLSLGKQVGDNIRCGYHGLEFDGSGMCVRNPHGGGQIPRSAALRTYPACERGGIVWVWMGRGEPTFETIPDLSIFEEGSPYQLGQPGWLSLDVPFDLMIDNLMDLSHAALLHENILGNEQSIAGETRFREENGLVYAQRLMPNIDPPEYFDLIYLNDGAKIDMWHDIHWQAPASLLLDIGSTHPGGTKDEGTSVLAQHIITPVTETSCMYHFMSARRNPPKRGEAEDAQIQARLFELRKMAFAEQDAPMIAAQYATIKRHGSYRPVALASIDKAVVLWRRRHEAALAAETAARAA
ncbi:MULTISPECIES: aromatic ring-hydroxylating dioxygenase subunit alpha [unclassified Sphingomonas]|uniref:aromatic ring-hydroxylating dioxygenase subunit alpha n=1 Tax=unclassified Sphingomonas TaxID=196159 RepID=UPI001300546D|nr:MULTISPECIES: aromatic ring-hydroxylating dioxygenase subunit alpha [unclassified Sphingomonas]